MHRERVHPRTGHRDSFGYFCNDACCGLGGTAVGRYQASACTEVELRPVHALELRPVHALELRAVHALELRP